MSANRNTFTLHNRALLGVELNGRPVNYTVVSSVTFCDSWTVTKDAASPYEAENLSLDQWCYDHFRNRDIYGRYGVASFVEMVRGKRLRWYGSVINAGNNFLVEFDLSIQVNSKI